MSTIQSSDNETNSNLIVTTKFMETFEIVRPVTPGSDFSLFLNSAGNLDIYSVGTANTVYRLRQNSKNDAAWSQQDLGFKARMLSVYSDDFDLDNPNIMGVDDAGKLTLSTYDAEFETYRQQVSQPGLADKKIIQFLATRKYDNVYANVILEDYTVGNSFLKSDGQWASRNWVPIKESEGSTQDAKAYKIAMCHNNPVQNALYAIGQDKSVLFADSKARFSYFTKLGTLKAIDLSVIEDSENRLNIFAVSDEDKAVYVKREKKYSSGDSIEWESWQLVSNTAKMKNIRTTINAAGVVEVFGIEDDERGTLFISREVKDSKGQRIGWTELFPLANPVPNSQFQVARNASGYSEAYTIARDTSAKDNTDVTYMYRFRQSPETTQWFSTPISLAESAEMISVPTHSLEMQVLYPNGAAYPFTNIRINASLTCTLRINGLAYIASPLQTVKLKTNAAGTLVANYVTTALASPTIFINTDDMEDGEGVTLEPNQQLQLKMHNVTKDDVLEARGAEGRLLLTGTPEEREKNADAISQVMQQSMTIGMPADGVAPGKLRYLSQNRHTDGLRFHPRGEQGSPYKLDMSEVPEQHWQVIFTDDGGIRFEQLDAFSAQHAISNINAQVLGGSFLGVDWGDFWNSVKQGFGAIWEGLKKIIVTTIIDPITKLVKSIKVVVELLIGGVTHIFEKVAEFFQQAFDIIEGIWAKIKVFFEDLYAWLAFLFNLADIGRTAEAVRHSINQTLDFTVMGIDAIKGQVAGALDMLSGELQKVVNNFLKSMDGQETIGQYGDKYQTPPGQEVFKEGNSHNVMLNGYMDNWEKTKVKEPNAIASRAPASALASMEELIKMMESLADNFQFGDGKAAFDEAVGYFSAIGDQPDQAINLVLKGSVKMMEAIMLFALDAAKGVILSLLDLVADAIILVKEMIDEEWEIPFVSQLYKFFTGKSLTFRVIDLFTYIIAIPGTLVYKIVEKKAPFPTDRSVEDFKALFTAQWLAEQSGIKPKGAATEQAIKLYAGIAPQEIIGPIFNVLGGTTYFVRIFTETGNIASVAVAKLAQQPDLPFSAQTFGIMNILGRFASSIFSTPWAMKADAGGFSCSDAQGLSNTIWLCQLLCGPSRGSILLVANMVSKGKIPTEVNDLTLTLWGAVHLGLEIWLITKGYYKNDGLKARAIMGTFGPQLFRFVLVGPLVTASKGITALALEIVVVLTFAANGIITLQNTPSTLMLKAEDIKELAAPVNAYVHTVTANALEQGK